MYIYDNISLNSYRMKNISEKMCKENKNTHFTFNNIYSEYSAVYEIMWKNMVQLGRPQMTIYCVQYNITNRNKKGKFSRIKERKIHEEVRKNLFVPELGRGWGWGKEK